MARLLATMLLAAGAARLPAQAPPSLTLFLRDPSGAAVRDARGYLRCRPEHQLTALADLPSPPSPRHEGRGNDRGELRFVGAGPNGEATAGSGMVWTEAGLGALVVAMPPGGARLVMQPMAAVTTTTGTEQFTLFARALLPGDRSVVLDPLQGTAVRLPAGDYEAWVLSADGWTWQLLSLRSGQTTTLAFGGAAQALQRRDDAALIPVSRPDLDLFGDSGEALLRGAARTATFLVATHGTLRMGDALPTVPTTSPLRWPPEVPWPTKQWRVPKALADLRPTLHCLRRRDDGGWQHLYSTTPRAARDLPVLAVPDPPPGDTWLLLEAEGQAPTATPWRRDVAEFPFELPQGSQLVVRARDETGLPIVDLALDYVPEGMDAAHSVAHADGRGEARFGDVHLPGVLRVSDERFANQELRLDQAPGDGVKITVRPGSELHGTAHWPDGRPAPHALVTLRDPQGRLRPAARTALTDDDGAFAFAGLPQSTPLLVFATARRDGHTWSTRRPGVVAGASPLALELRDEDPQLESPSTR